MVPMLLWVVRMLFWILSTPGVGSSAGPPANPPMKKSPGVVADALVGMTVELVLDGKP